jgi:hypothetical protein
MFLEGAPERDDQRLAILQRALHGLANGTAFVRNHAGIEYDEAADEAGVGMVGLHIFAEHGNAFFKIVNAILGLEQHAVDCHYAFVIETGNESGHSVPPSVNKRTLIID